jgi:hypothetical protein
MLPLQSVSELADFGEHFSSRYPAKVTSAIFATAASEARVGITKSLHGQQEAPGARCKMGIRVPSCQKSTQGDSGQI